MRIIKLDSYKEGINDKNLFKAVILAGGPGSGKSFISENMFLVGSGGVSPFGVKVVNSDFFFELGLEKANLPKVIDQSKETLYKQQTAIRTKAKELSKARQGHLINGMLPIIIDGTGRSYDKIHRQSEELKASGYDVSMVFVNTSLDVALKRNNKRERKVDSRIVEQMWYEVQSNIGKFQSYFGTNNFVVIDNNEYFEPGSIESEIFLNRLFKIGKKLVEEPLQNRQGKFILNTLRKTGGKYLNDLEFNNSYTGQ